MAVPLFLLVFFLIYGSVHLYALAKVQTAFGFGWRGSVAVIPVLGVLCAGPVLVHVLGIHEMGLAARVASWTGYTWMGLLFFFTWLNLAMDAVNLGARLLTSAVGRGPNPLIRHGKITCLVLVGLSAGLCVYASVEASRVQVEHVRILTDKLPASVSRLRIAQISDVHLGLMVRRRQAIVIADLVRSVQPDLVVSTGDLVDARPNHLDGLSEIFRQISAPSGNFRSPGIMSSTRGSTRRSTSRGGRVSRPSGARRSWWGTFCASPASTTQLRRRWAWLPVARRRRFWAPGPPHSSRSSSSIGRCATPGRSRRSICNSPGIRIADSSFLSSFWFASRILSWRVFTATERTVRSTSVGGPAPGALACGFYPLRKSRCWTSSADRSAALHDIGSSVGRPWPTPFVQATFLSVVAPEGDRALFWPDARRG